MTAKKPIDNRFLNMGYKILFIVFAGMLIASTHPQCTYAQDGAISDIDIDDLEFDVDKEWDDYEEFKIHDPYEKYNRWMFNVNDKIYRRVFTPLSNGYDFLIPQKVQGSFNNLFRFVSFPKRFFNNLFQKKFKSSFIEFERLLINATLGVGGLFDPADSLFHLEEQTEDFGQTLGFYGTEPGAFIIWPIIGPSTVRDTFGTGIDQGFSVTMWLSIYDVEPEDAWPAFGTTRRVNNYSYNVRDNYERITEGAIDPYIALQHAYIKNREKKIKD